MGVLIGPNTLYYVIVRPKGKLREDFDFSDEKVRKPALLRPEMGERGTGDMATTVIAITNQKGGVGKTTTAAALLTGLHRRGAAVLGVDMDPQGSLGFSLGLDIEHCTTIYDVFRGQAEPEQGHCTDRYLRHPSSTFCCPARSWSLTGGREFLLKTALSKVEDQYDYIIIDTPPALSLLTVNAYVATDSLIIPMSPEILSLLGVSQIKETIESVRSYYNSRLRVLGILLNKFSARLTLNREVLEMAEQIAAQLDTRVFQSKIRGSVSVAESPAHGVSVLDYAPRSKPSLDFEALCEEIAGGFIPHGGRRTDGEVR